MRLNLLQRQGFLPYVEVPHLECSDNSCAPRGGREFFDGTCWNMFAIVTLVPLPGEAQRQSLPSSSDSL